MKYRDMDVWKVSVEFAAEIQRVVARMNGEARGVIGRGLAEAALNVGSRLAAGASAYRKEELEKQVFLYDLPSRFTCSGFLIQIP